MSLRANREGCVPSENATFLATFRPQAMREARPREEYGWEYRRVSVSVSILQFAAATTPGGCRLFHFAAIRSRRSGKTLDPKVARSIPARPIAILLQIQVVTLWVARALLEITTHPSGSERR